MDSEPVKLWRDTFRLNLSASWKRDVEITVKDINLWKSILDNWFYIKNGKKIKKSPGIKNLLAEYERREFDKLEAANGNNKTPVVSTRGGEGISERSDGPLREVRGEPPSLYFRTRNLVR